MSKKFKVSRLQQAKDWVGNLPTHTKIIIMAIFIFMLIIAALIYLVSATSQKAEPIDDLNLTAEQKARRDANVRQAQREGIIRDSAEEAVNNGDLARASEIYKEAINAESDTAKKVQLYKDQSNVLYAAGKYKEAIAVAREAESISDDKFIIADWLSRLYEDQKQYAKAAEYYKLAAEWAKSPTNKARLDADHYNKQAQRVLILAGQKQ